jgi:hypothetical protein
MAHRSSFVIDPGDIRRLEELARDLGYIQRRGPGKVQGSGNISALLRAMARGDLEVRLKRQRDALPEASGRDHE